MLTSHLQTWWMALFKGEGGDGVKVYNMRLVMFGRDVSHALF